ncbi:aldehyde dehydrogenase family protein [Pseudalkalibacillus decolorationis]|uniref:aldehyde dehydrogenase family protein n=1 Tax=Pseudalkalibacillus decolorationis TaxID=163879 RepID=UPI00214805D6|nr:aldehyde dehydrogenase family protein [Pseudalkalibacillus decolorationis]
MVKGLFIEGMEVTPTNTYAVIQPHTEEVVAQVADATESEMQQAVDSAYKAFGEMKALSSADRAGILNRVADLLEEVKEDFARTIALEACKPITAARGEVDRSVQTLRFSADEAKHIGGEYIPLDAAKGGEGRDAYTIHEPIGIVGAITPFNFPLNLVVHKVGPALAAGNTIIVKPAEQTPLSSLKLAELFIKAGLPDGAFNVIPGDGPKLGRVLLDDSRVQKISFTGSPQVGKLIKSQAGLKRVTLELGSNSALYVDESSKDSLEDIASKAVTGAFVYNGQVCISTQRIYVHESVFEDFKQSLVSKTKKVPFGDPLDDDTMVTSLINKKSQQRILKWINEAVESGATLLTGGEAKANGILLTVLTDIRSTDKVSCQEVFGPVVILQPVKDDEEALNLMNDSDFGLNAGVFTNNLQQALAMAHGLDVGQVLVNDIPTTRFDHMPYGGVKSSGYGHEGVKYAIREMTRLKMISLNYRF